MAQIIDTTVDLLTDNTTKKNTPALVRSVFKGLAKLGPNRRPAGLVSVVHLTHAEAVAAGYPARASLDQLDQADLFDGKLARVGLHPDQSGQLLVLTYDGRLDPFEAGKLRGYSDGNCQAQIGGAADGLVPLKWVKQGSTEDLAARVRRYAPGIVDWALDETMKIELGGTDTFYSAKTAGGPFPAPLVAGLSTASWKATLVQGSAVPPAPLVYFDPATRRLTASHPQYKPAQLEFCYPGQPYSPYTDAPPEGVQVGNTLHEANVFLFRVKATATTGAGAVAGNPQLAAATPGGAQQSQALTLAQARALNHQQVEAGCLYLLDFGPDQAGYKQTISVLGVSSNAFSVRGILEVNGVQTAVRVNVDSGVFGEEASYLTLIVTDVSAAKRAAVVSAVANSLANGGLASALDSAALAPGDGLASLDYVAREFIDLAGGAGYLYKCYLDANGQVLWFRFKVQ